MEIEMPQRDDRSHHESNTEPGEHACLRRSGPTGLYGPNLVPRNLHHVFRTRTDLHRAPATRERLAELDTARVEPHVIGPPTPELAVHANERCLGDREAQNGQVLRIGHRSSEGRADRCQRERRDRSHTVPESHTASIERLRSGRCYSQRVMTTFLSV